MSNAPKIFVNVSVDKSNEERIAREEQTWTSGRLVALLFATLGVSLVILYAAAQTTSETFWSDWLTPG